MYLLVLAFDVLNEPFILLRYLGPYFMAIPYGTSSVKFLCTSHPSPKMSCLSLILGLYLLYLYWSGISSLLCDVWVCFVC